MNLLLVCGMKDTQLISKISALVEMNEVRQIYLVRKNPIKYDKVICFCPPKLLAPYKLMVEAYKFIMVGYLLALKKIDFVISIFMFLNGFYALFWGWLFRKPVIQQLVGSDLIRILDSEIYLKTLKAFDVITTRGENSKDILIKAGVPHEKTYPIPNSFRFIENEPENIKNRTHKYDLIFIGDLETIKGPLLFCDIVKKLKQNCGFPQIKAVMVGEGSLKSNLIDKIELDNLSDNITLRGWQNNVDSVLTASKVLVNTSIEEGLPMVIVEAMNQGLPCVVPDLYDITTVAKTGENSFVVAPSEIASYVEHIRALLTDTLLYQKISMGAQKLKDEKEFEFSDENIALQWRKIFSMVKVK